MTDSFTICIVTLNSSRTLQRTIDSLLEQTAPLVPIILQDGGSTDDTLNIARRAISKGLPLEIFEAKDNGISHGFNLALKQVKSTYVTYLNSDDTFYPNYIHTILNILRAHTHYDILIPSIVFQTESSRRLLNYRFSPDTFSTPQINFPGMLIRTDLLRRIGGFDQKYARAMDVAMFYRLQQFQPIVLHLDQPLVTQFDGGVSRASAARTLTEVAQIEIENGRNTFSALAALSYRLIKSKVANLLRQTL